MTITVEKVLGIVNLSLILLLWVFMITVNDISGKAYDKSVETDIKVNSISQKVDLLSEPNRIDTIIVNMCIQDYVKVKNNINKK